MGLQSLEKKAIRGFDGKRVRPGRKGNGFKKTGQGGAHVPDGNTTTGPGESLEIPRQPFTAKGFLETKERAKDRPNLR